MSFWPFFLVLIASLTGSAQAGEFGAPPMDIDQKLDALVKAYPDYLSSHDGKELVWRDGTKMQISDGRTNKSFKELLNSPDIDDMFAFHYPVGTLPSAPPVNYDPGRIRYEPLFLKMYGDCKSGATNPKTTQISWLKKHRGRKLPVNNSNGVHKAIKAVSSELEKLPDKFVKYLKPSAGTYSCRVISGTKRLSVHAFAAAIDISVKTADYWKWSKPNQNGVYVWRNKIPSKIIEIFEDHGFIWGGRWYHHDTMHFEYRPELIAK